MTGRARALLVGGLAVALAGGLALEAHLTSSNASIRKAGRGADSTTSSSATSTSTSSTTAPPPPANVPRVHAAAGTYATVVGLSPLPGACGDENPAVVAAAMAQAVDTGVTMIRCDLNWWNIQPQGPTQFAWTQYDNVVNAAYDSGMKLVFVPEYTPPWAQPKTLPPKTIPSHIPPAKTSDYVNFVNEALQRYSPVGSKRPTGLRGSVRIWEIWNEPNIPGFWNPPNALAYGAFLKATTSAIKAIDKQAIVISGGLAPAANQHGNIAPDSFVAQLAPTGALSVVDGVGVHPYTFPAWPTEKVGWNPFIGVVPRVHRVMDAFGAGNKKIWATEIGWPTATDDPQTHRLDGTPVGTEAYQASMIPATIKAWSAFPYAGPIIIYEQRDKCQNLKSWFCMNGLEHVDGSKKPAYDAMKQYLTRKLGT